MPCFIGSGERVPTKQEREEFRRRLDARHRLERAWYGHYRALGLGHWRATEHAGRRAAKGKAP